MCAMIKPYMGGYWEAQELYANPGRAGIGIFRKGLLEGLVPDLNLKSLHPLPVYET